MSEYGIGTNHVDRLLDDGAPMFVRQADQALDSGNERPGRVPVDVFETAGYLVIRALVPGAGLDDLDATIVRDTLRLTGCLGPACTNGSEHLIWHGRGIAPGRFAETIPLPVPVDVDRGLATYGDGILTVQFPKADPPGAKRIPIRPTARVPR